MSSGGSVFPLSKSSLVSSGISLQEISRAECSAKLHRSEWTEWIDTHVVDSRTVEDLNWRRIETLERFMPRGLIRKWSRGEVIVAGLNKSRDCIGAVAARAVVGTRAINGVGEWANIRPRGYQFTS